MCRDVFSGRVHKAASRYDPAEDPRATREPPSGASSTVAATTSLSRRLVPSVAAVLVIVQMLL